MDKFYRLGCVTKEGQARGHQWRQITQEDFVKLAQGRRVLADAQAQILNSSQIDTSFDDGPVYFQYVWHEEQWRDDLSEQAAVDLWLTSGRDKAGD